MCTAFRFAHKLFSKHELVLLIKQMFSLKGNLSARAQNSSFTELGGKKDLFWKEGEGSQITEVKNEIKADVAEIKVEVVTWGMDDLSNAAPHRAEHAYGAQVWAKECSLLEL